MPSVPIAYSTDTSENFDNLKHILEVVKYNEHQWRICCDLKIVSLITGLTASGRPKYPCFCAIGIHDTEKVLKEETSTNSITGIVALDGNGLKTIGYTKVLFLK